MSDPFYRSAAWRRLRARVLGRQPICATPGCGRRSTHADHVVPRAQGGADDAANLRGLCESCHNRRTASGNGGLCLPGCDADGRPLDPTHAWHDGKSLGAGRPRPCGVAAQSKFRGARWD